MPSMTISLFLSFILLISAPLTLAAPSHSSEGKPSLAPPTHLRPYTNPSTSSECNLDCRRVFCSSVSQFLESVTCTQHRPCLSLNLQFKIQEKCLNWRPEIHHGSEAAAIDGVATHVSAKADVAAVSSNDSLDPDCMGGASPSAPQWVKAYVPADIGYEWLRKGKASHTHPAPAAKDEVNREAEGMCLGVLRWVCLVGVAVALFCAWKVKDRKAVVDRRVKGKEELA